jgi:uncharacterized protein YndB with AHSA1/START domain
MTESTFDVDQARNEVTITREFAAPPELMFEVYTKAEHIPHWWTNTTVDKLDARPGGEWRFESEGKGGYKFACGGVFQDVTPPSRIVQTFGMESNPGHDFVQTITFEPSGTGTLMTTVSTFKTAEDMTNTVNYGMETGAEYGYGRIDTYIAELQAVKA